MLTPAEAEKIILESIATFHREDCPLANAHGRVLRADLVADRDLPPFDRVTMDGYALRAAALAAGTRTFRIEATQAAGMRAFKLGPAADACIEIMTGAVLPEGADCVVPYEETTRADAGKLGSENVNTAAAGTQTMPASLATAAGEKRGGPASASSASGATITVSAEAAQFTAGHALHRRGSDHRAKDVLVPAGTRLTGREIAVAAACGYASLAVSQVPKVAVVSTGDELVEVGAAVAPHQIRRSNDHALRAALIGAGYPAVTRFHLRDVRHEIEHMLWHILAEFDVVIITGGVSKGKYDFLPSELEKQGVKKKFHGVAQRPGKPFWFGRSQRHTAVFALPGNPVSAYTCLHRYVLPALAHASKATRPPLRTVVLGAATSFKPPLAHLLPVKLSSGPRAELLAHPDATNSSGDFAGLLATDGFVELPQGPGQWAAGTLVPFWGWV